MGALKTRNDWNAALENLNHTDLQYGFGRLDAIGHIFNKTALLAMPSDGAHQTANPSDAPVRLSVPVERAAVEQGGVERAGR